MSDSAKKLTKLDDLIQSDHLEGLKSLIVDSPKAFAAEELFEVRFDETRLGPIWNQDLKAYVAQDPNFPISCFVSQFAAEEWMPILQHPFFQRRRPQLVARNDLNIENEAFHVLREGKKHGPFTALEIQEKVNNGKILISDQVSTDGGHSWGRLYEIEEFDRRDIVPSGELPFMPEWQVFNNSFDEVEQSLGDMNHNSRAMETDAIASLAYLENLQSGKAGRIQEIQSTETAEHGPLPKVVIATVLAMAMGLILASWLASRPSAPVVSNTPDNLNSQPTRAVAPKAKSQPIAPSRLGQDVKRDTTPLSERVINRVNRAPTNNSANSFRKSKAFKKTVKPYEPNNNDFTYDNERPLEQDPIGSKLSRDTINPDDDYQKELREEGISGDIDYASDRFPADAKKAEDDFAQIYNDEDGANIGESGAVDQINDDVYDSY